jgi:hypothetical protein
MVLCYIVSFYTHFVPISMLFTSPAFDVVVSLVCGHYECVLCCLSYL